MLRRLLRVICRASILLWHLIWRATIVCLVALLVYVASMTAKLESSYFAKYENAHAQCIREHQRQGMVNMMIRTRATLEGQNEAMTVAFLREQEKNHELIKTMKQHELEVLMFMKTLQRVDPDAFRRTVEALQYTPPLAKPKKKNPC